MKACVLGAVAVLLGARVVAAEPASPVTSRFKGPPPFSTEVERCILPAAEYHVVNPYVLRAILKVESGLKPAAIGKNTNGTVDVGVGQMNSMHFRELQKHGVQPNDLLDACVGTYVSAWHLSKIIVKHGNSWEAIARYHSGTPYFNQRYRALLNNELVRTGVLAGKVVPVPPMIKAGGGEAPKPHASAPTLKTASSVAYDFQTSAP